MAAALAEESRCKPFSVEKEDALLAGLQGLPESAIEGIGNKRGGEIFFLSQVDKLDGRKRAALHPLGEDERGVL